jgi:hypothetical protein
MMANPRIPSLQAANQHLRARLSRLAGGNHTPAGPVATEFTDLLAELQHSASCLRNLPMASLDAEMLSEISEYRSQIQQVAKILPSLQARLLIERVRLEAARAHVAKAAAWAQGSKKVL